MQEYEEERDPPSPTCPIFLAALPDPVPRLRCPKWGQSAPASTVNTNLSNVYGPSTVRTCKTKENGASILALALTLTLT